MQFKKTAVIAAFVYSALAAVAPTDYWTTLTPTGTFPGATTDYPSTFGLAVVPITETTLFSISSAATSIPTGKSETQTQVTESSTLTQVTQITDGQIQVTTVTEHSTTLPPITQITDGQIQATTVTKHSTTLSPITQITDGQIQAPTTLSPVTQMTDSQIQASVLPSVYTSGSLICYTMPDLLTTKTTSATTQVYTSNSAQTEVTTLTTKTTTQAQETTTYVHKVSCKTNGTLELTLKHGILRDGNGRIGSIVSNYQFQFDGPPPQAGAIYAAGWGITPDGYLALGDTDIFYQCRSGDFYNLYYKNIAPQCSPVKLAVVDLVDC